ncbi:MAG: imm11 family protein [Steroidobacter sp.]
MSDYFVLRAAPSIERGSVQGYMEIEDWDVQGFDDWGRGTRAEQRPSGPVEIKAVPYDGYAGLPDDFQDASVPVMSKRLKEAIQSAGVDNIDFAPVTLRNSESGEAYEYFAFNLIGLVSAADRAGSAMASHDGDFLGDTRIYGLAVKESMGADFLMFRLKEKFSVVMVHRTVRAAIERAGIDTIRFVEPEEFMAL